MKKIMMTVLAISLLSSLSWTQEETGMPPIPPKRSKAAKVGAFGGFMPGWLFVDTAPINSFLQAAGGAPLNDDGVLMVGGGGAAYIMLVPNLRIGGMGMGGDISSTSLNTDGVRRDAELSVGFGGVTIEYVFPVLERFDIAVGGMLGGGGIDITLRQDAGGNKTWNQEWGNFGTGNYQIGGQINNITRKLSGSYFVWIPSVNFEYAVIGWGGVRLGMSFVGMSSPSWKLDDKYDLLGVPGNINGEGWMINAGIFVGTF